MDLKFYQKLSNDFPDIFVDGKAMCGVYCPDGWQPMVYETCKLISIYSNSHRLIKNEMWFAKILYKISSFCISFLDLPNIDNFSDAQKELYITLCPRELFINRQLYKIKRFSQPWSKKPYKEVKIDQIKEKFGVLRIYVSGGDDFINGVISHAEFLSATISQESGLLNASLYSKNSWYKTLTREEAKDMGYIHTTY